MIKTFAILFALFPLLISCVSPSYFADRAIAYNKTLENAQNRAALLNIIRASKRQPLHLSTFSVIRGSGTASTSIGLSVPFGGDAPDSFTLSPSFTLGQGPSFDIAPLDSQEFWRGFLTPINMTTVDYYINQQWPKSLLFYLLFEKVDVVKNGRVVDSYDNYPGDHNKFLRYGQLMDRFIEAGLTTETAIDIKAIGPILTREEIANVEHLVEAAKAGLSVQSVGDQFQLARPITSTVFCFAQPSVQDIDIPVPTCAQARAGELLEDKSTPGVEFLLAPLTEKEVETVQSTVRQQPSGLKIYLRSAEGVLYYLGEIARIQLTEARDVRIGFKENRENLLAIKTGSPIVEPFVVVTHEGTEYFIPRENAGRSAHALSLLLQLIALNKSVKDLPVTGVVTVVGGGG